MRSRAIGGKSAALEGDASVGSFYSSHAVGQLAHFRRFFSIVRQILRRPIGSDFGSWGSTGSSWHQRLTATILREYVHRAAATAGAGLADWRNSANFHPLSTEGSSLWRPE